MSFLAIENWMLSDEFENNERIQMSQSVAWVWSYIDGYMKSMQKPCTMNTKGLAKACCLSPYQLNKILIQFEDWGILVRKDLEDNAMGYRSHWVAPASEFATALMADEISTWAARNSNLEPLPELLPPAMQPRAFAIAKKEAPEAKPPKNGTKKVDGVWLRFDDHVVIDLWKEFISIATEARKGFISVKGAQFFANQLNKAITPQLAALYLSNAIDEGHEVISVPAEWQQKKSESVAFKIYDFTLQAIAAKKETRTAEHWEKVVDAGRKEFADSFWFPLLESMQNPIESAGVWTLDVLDAEHVGLYEALVAPAFLDLLKSQKIRKVEYKFAKLDGRHILRRAGAWKEQHAHFEAVNGHAFDVEAYLKAAGIRGFEHWVETQAIENAFDTNEVDASPAEAVLPWETESFAGIWDEWKDYREVHFELSFLSIEDEQRALFRMQIHFANEADAYNAIGMAIANGYSSIIHDNVKAPAITASAFG